MTYPQDSQNENSESKQCIMFTPTLVFARMIADYDTMANNHFIEKHLILNEYQYSFHKASVIPRAFCWNTFNLNKVMLALSTCHFAWHMYFSFILNQP